VCEIRFNLILVRVSSSFQAVPAHEDNGPAHKDLLHWRVSPPVLARLHLVLAFRGVRKSSVLALPPLKRIGSFRTRGFLHYVGLGSPR